MNIDELMQIKKRISKNDDCICNEYYILILKNGQVIEVFGDITPISDEIIEVGTNSEQIRGSDYDFMSMVLFLKVNEIIGISVEEELHSELLKKELKE